MNTLIRFGISGALAALFMKAGGTPDSLILWKSTLEQRSFSHILVFLVLGVFFFLTVSNSIRPKYVSIVSGTALVIASVLLYAVIAWQVLGADVFFRVPASIANVIGAAYAFQSAILIYFASLYTIKRF